MAVTPQAETLGFEAEVAQLLKLVAHNLYSDNEIFLRELISNASDAADKLRYEALSNEALLDGDNDLKIWVSFDKKHRFITIRDNGIGMDRDDVISHLGTIAKSGTAAFRDMLSSNKSGESNLIGQFGVGFYSAFVVSDRVIVRSRKAGLKGDEAVEWESNGEGEYTVKNISKADRGTEIILHLKEDSDEFLEDMRLRTIIKKYSDHIMLPILMHKIDVPAAEDKEGDDKDKKAEENTAPEWEVVNQATALWAQPKGKITDEQYQDLYKHVSHDFRDALTWTHSRVEGKSDYISLLYIPEHAPFDMWTRDQNYGLKLYVKRVFIMDDAEHFLPMYLRFVRGIIDSSDLPLNISRELLQSNKMIDSIKTGSVKKILGMLEKLAKDDVEKYQSFWKEFGAVLKEGPAEDFANKDRIMKLMRFATTKENVEAQTVSLEDYVSRMKEGQEKIYYVSADSFAAAKNSPLLEAFKKHGTEVLLLSDRVDEWWVGHANEFEGKQFQSIAKGKVDFGDAETEEEKEEQKKQEDNFSGLIKQFTDILGDQVKEVRLTNRLTDSAACVVFDENEMSGHMQRLLASAGQAVPASKPIFELNPEHALLGRIKNETDDERLADWADVLLSQALLAEGQQLDDPAAFVKRLNTLLV